MVMAVITQSNGTVVYIIGAGATTLSAVVDFGFATGEEGDVATVTVAAPTVTADQNIICSALATPTADHDPDDVVVEGIVVAANNIVPGVGFDITATAVNNSWGRYNVVAVF